MKLPVLAIVLSILSLVLAAGFGILTAICGGHEVDAVEQGQPQGPQRCVSNFHPFAAVWAAFAIMGAVGLWFHQAWPSIVLGAIGTALGVLSGFSSGYFGIGCGLLLLTAGLIGRMDMARRPDSA